MLFLAAGLFAIASGCSAWVIIGRQSSRQLIAQRITNIPAKHSGVGNVLGSIFKMRNNSNKEITLQDITNDKIAHDLFLAGYHSQKAAHFFHLIVRISMVLPFFLILIHLISGSLTPANALKSLGIGLTIFCYVKLVLKMARQKRQRMILRSLPQFLDIIVVCVEAGLGFTAAIERILKEVDPSNPLTKELNLMYHEFLGGLSLSQACERMDKRCEVPDLSLLLTSIVQSDQMGSSLGTTLRTQASEIRDKYKQRVRSRALQIPVKILFPMLPIFFAFLILNLALVGFEMNRAISGNQPVKTDVKDIKSDTSKKFKN